MGFLGVVFTQIRDDPRAIFKEKAPIFSIEALDTISDGLLLGVELRDTVLVTCFDDVAL